MPSDKEEKIFEREQLLAGFLTAVKGCQIRYGGRTELATESDPCVATLCQCLEETLSHGLRTRILNRGIGAIRQVTDFVSSGLNIHLTLGNTEPDQPVLWWYVRELLTRHEYERFLLLRNVDTDHGRGKAWLRSLLNEHSLERYIHIMVSDQEFLEQWYEPWGLLRDQERAAMLPNLAAGLDSILFAISIDNELLNHGASKQAPSVAKKISNLGEAEPQAALLATKAPPGPSPSTTKLDYKKRKKKIPSQLVSFDEKSSSSGISTSPQYHSAPATSVNSPAATTGDQTPYSDSLNKIIREKEFEQAKEELRLPDSDCAEKSSFSGTSSSSSTGNYPAESNEGPEKSYNEIIEDLISSQADGLTPLAGLNSYKGKRAQSSQRSVVSASVQSSDQENCSFTSTDSTEGRKYIDSELGHSSLIPLTGEPYDLMPLSPDGEAAFDFSGIDDGGSIKSSQGECDSEGAFGEVDVEKPEEKRDISSSVSLGSMASALSGLSSPSISKGSTVTPSSFSSLTIDELRTAVLEISRMRDAIEERRAEVASALSREMETSSTLRAQLTHEQTLHAETVERLSSKSNALSRENELLRHQLKKYVGAVQMLRREGGGESPNAGGDSLRAKLPPDLRDYHDEAVAYESKLIQVAEMHGELMEFNERLQKHLKLREAQVRHLRDELVELRGPFPEDQQEEEIDDTISITSDFDSYSSPRTLINIWIPTAFLAGPSSDTHHVYQIYVRIRDDEWNVYRRFAQFYELHRQFKKKEPIVKTFDFPQKKTFGYKDISVVEDRRLRLQQYLRRLVNLLVANSSTLATEPDKAALTSVLPFLLDVPQSREANNSRKKSTRKFLSRLANRQENPQPQVPQYNGL